MAAIKPTPGGGDFLTRKLGPFPMIVWIAAGVALAYLYTRNKSTNSSSTTDQTTAAEAAQGVTAQQYGYSGADLASMLEQLQAQVAGLGAGNSGTTTSGAPSPGNTQTGGTNQTHPAPPGPTPQPYKPIAHVMPPANPYAVGKVVAPGEKITAGGLYVPGFGWVDPTSRGGLYTSPGTAISGSGYNPRYSGAAPTLKLVGSNQVQEYEGSKLVGTYTLRK